MGTEHMRRTRVVIVIEDDRPIGELLASVINDEDGYVAVHVSRPSDALHALQQVVPDLLFIDVGLPGMNGLELYDKIRKDDRLKRVPVVFETAWSQEYAPEFKRRGITAILQKPFDLRDVLKRVHQLAPAFAPAFAPARLH
jgi:two-component system, sensor histidine kinase and response regulator